MHVPIVKLKTFLVVNVKGIIGGFKNNNKNNENLHVQKINVLLFYLVSSFIGGFQNNKKK